jgi:putative heme-binding domain-containing protein
MLQGPANKAKDEVIAKLIPEVNVTGDLAKGRELFKTTCATCHRFGDLGADVGPSLTGMGSHGPAELLVHIVDPNRQVDPSFATWNIETKDGKLYAGIVSAENQSTISLKSLAGPVEIRQEEIKRRVNTGRSLMPEGLEGIGGESLRDILTFICAPVK